MELTPEQEAIAWRAANETVMTSMTERTRIISDAIARAVEPVQALYAKSVDDHAETHYERDRLREKLRAQSEDKKVLIKHSHGRGDFGEDYEIPAPAQSEDTETGWVLRDEICERVPWDTPSKQAWVRVRYAVRKKQI